MLFARERPGFVTARRASFPVLCRVRFDESAPPFPRLTPQLKQAWRARVRGDGDARLGSAFQAPAFKCLRGDNFRSAQPSGGAGGEMVYS
jgi:hypothetical protein